MKSSTTFKAVIFVVVTAAAWSLTVFIANQLAWLFPPDRLQ